MPSVVASDFGRRQSQSRLEPLLSAPPRLLRLQSETHLEMPSHTEPALPWPNALVKTCDKALLSLQRRQLIQRAILRIDVYQSPTEQQQKVRFHLWKLTF